MVPYSQIMTALKKHENTLEPKTLVMSVGGSLVVPNGNIDTDFLSGLREVIKTHAKDGWRFVIVVGGGGTARHYQSAARDVVDLTREDLDWLGIHSTRLNGHLMRTIFRDLAHPKMITDPTNPPDDWTQDMLVAAGWRPGWSTDYVSTCLAKELGTDLVVNLSNIDYLYSEDPNKNPDAEPIANIGWEKFRTMVGDEWDPGMNVPFDPVASKMAQKEDMRVILANGGNLENLNAILDGEAFAGTVIE